MQLGLDMLAEKRRIRSHIERLVGPPPRVQEGGSIRVHHHLRPRH
jgi:hypothetical protein